MIEFFVLEICHWDSLPQTIQIKIINYVNGGEEIYFEVMFVSKSFRRCVEIIYYDIYEVSIALCTKKTWFNKTHKCFLQFLTRINWNCYLKFDPDEDSELLNVYLGGSLFNVLLHFFYCKRACENDSVYCKICSRVRIRHYQDRAFFENVKCLRENKLGLQDRELTYDIFMNDYKRYSSETDFCRMEYYFYHTADIVWAFLSILGRIHLNLLYKYFDKIEMSISDEKYVYSCMNNYVQKIIDAFFSININYFFIIFNKFRSLNYSACYDIAPDAKFTYSPLKLQRKVTDKDSYEYEYQLYPNEASFEYD